MIYIMGAGGFLGRHLRARLAGSDITLITTSTVENHRVMSANAFFLNDNFSEHDQLFLAGNSYLTGSVSGHEIRKSVGYLAGELLAAASHFFNSGGRHLINFRSYMELQGGPLNQGQAIYRAAKLAQGKAIEQLSTKNRALCQNFFLYDNFGLQDWRQKLLNAVRHNRNNDISTEIANPNIYIDLMPVEVQVKTILNQVSVPVSGSFSVCTGEPYTLFELARILESSYGCKFTFGLSSSVRQLPYLDLLKNEKYDLCDYLDEFFEEKARA